jgi:hypothetical protein
MMELRDALTQIAEIRLQMAQTQIFRGYRSVPVAFSGLLAFAGASVQSWVVPRPQADIAAYLTLWIGLAAVSMLAAGIEMAARYRRAEPGLTREITRLALELFLPSVVAGGLLTFVLTRHAPQVLWMLPGLWAVMFSMGMFASLRLMPRPLILVAVYYLLAGTLCLVYAQGPYAFSPWAMALSFGGGQTLTAALLYWTLERNDGRS